MSFIRRFAAGCYPIVIPICLVAIVSLIGYALGFGDFAAVFSWYGTVVTVLGVVLYIVFVDAKSRWPKDHWFVRFHKLVTFSRR